jgi:hypothetical protein
MKKLTILLFLACFVITSAISQINRFDNHTNYDLEMEWHVPDIKTSANSDCYKIYDKIKQITDNMATIAALPNEVKSYYEKKGFWIENNFYQSEWLLSAKWIFAEGIFNSPFIEITLKNGNKYYYDDVPKQTFILWFNASSPGDFYHTEIKQYSLNRYIPDICR